MKANRLSFSIVICTLNNISGLKKCIESIINQTLKANEVIIVHGGDRSSTLKYIEVINKLNNTNYIYLKKQKSLVRQRNAGVKHASSDVIFFIDDDAIMDSDYFEIIMDYYTKYWETNLGGVQGTIWQHKQMKFNINTWFRKFFLNSVLNGTGKLQPSGYPSFINYCDTPIEVEVFNGCMMSFKKQVFANDKFNREFEEYWWGDDFEFSFRISKMYKLVQLPNAIVYHESTTPLYEGMGKIWFMAQYNRRKIFNKYFSNKRINYLYYYWSIIGDLIIGISQSIKSNSTKPISGVLKGLKQ